MLVLPVVAQCDLQLYGGELLGLLQGDWQHAQLDVTLGLFVQHVELDQIPGKHQYYQIMDEILNLLLVDCVTDIPDFGQHE